MNLQHFMQAIPSTEPFSGELRFNEAMSAHTTFQLGGPADVWVQPSSACFERYVPALMQAAAAAGVPVYILGCGANLVVADKGIRGVVLDTQAWSAWNRRGDGNINVRSGTRVDALLPQVADAGLSGMEFLAGMPGSIGGAVWMNARCYEREIADVLIETNVLEASTGGEWLPRSIRRTAGDFAYKKSPFQAWNGLILSATFKVEAKDPASIRKEIEAHRRDREQKGHYRYPSAGSAFKNNRDWGKPTGQIIDELGLKGFSVGAAMVAPWHGNLIINTGGASAHDIRNLVDALIEKVQAGLGITLEPEILFVGDWGR